MLNKSYKELTRAVKIYIAYYCLHQLFEYRLAIEMGDFDDLSKFEVYKNPTVYLDRLEKLLRDINLDRRLINKIRRIDKITADEIDDISLTEIERKYDIILGDTMLDINNESAFKLLNLKME